MDLVHFEIGFVCNSFGDQRRVGQLDEHSPSPALPSLSAPLCPGDTANDCNRCATAFSCWTALNKQWSNLFPTWSLPSCCGTVSLVDRPLSATVTHTLSSSRHSCRERKLPTLGECDSVIRPALTEDRIHSQSRTARFARSARARQHLNQVCARPSAARRLTVMFSAQENRDF
jgi:hypothetical protein